MRLSDWLDSATTKLKSAGIESARLDTLLLLKKSLGYDKSWLLAHPEHILDSNQQIELNRNLEKRLNHQPMAYIMGVQEFYGRDFKVTKKVLIPRPETEDIISLLINLKPNPGDKLIDVGTGSGIIAITAKLEIPNLGVSASDISKDALDIARDNAKNLQANVDFIQGDLLLASPKQKFRFIVANLPYVSSDWRVSPETKYEPQIALYAQNKGLALINKLINQSVSYILPDGFLILEADIRQHNEIITLATASGYHLRTKQGLILVFEI